MFIIKQHLNFEALIAHQYHDTALSFFRLVELFRLDTYYFCVQTYSWVLYEHVHF